MFIKNNFPRIFTKDADLLFRVEMDKHNRNLADFKGRIVVEYEGPEVKRMKPFMGSCSIGFCLAQESEIIEEKMTAIETARGLGPGAHEKEP